MGRRAPNDGILAISLHHPLMAVCELAVIDEISRLVTSDDVLLVQVVVYCDAPRNLPNDRAD